MIKVGLIDDNYFLLNNYKEFLQDFADISVVFTFTSLEELRKDIQHGILVEEPDIILLDVIMPGQTGIDEVKKLSDIYPDSHVIVMSKYEDQQYIVQSLLSGAKGFLSKNSKPMDIYASIHDVYNAGASLSPQVAKKLIDYLKGNVTELLAARLTKREIELVHLLKEGLSYKQMAEKLFVSVYTINHHLKNIYQKLGVESKSELISRILQKTI
ncbi:MAG: response regulator transcription factor [Chitinophagaceae bacterium]|nr:response regulator transcription factor [Chitinophagaceae bacterium]